MTAKAENEEIASSLLFSTAGMLLVWKPRFLAKYTVYLCVTVFVFIKNMFGVGANILCENKEGK